MTAPYFHDGPTGPIDFLDELNPVVREILEDDEQPRTADGRFSFKDKPVEYVQTEERRTHPTLGAPPPKPERRRNPIWRKHWTIEELESFGEFGPDYEGPHLTALEWPSEPGVVKDVFGNGTCQVFYPEGAQATVKVGQVSADPEVDGHVDSLRALAQSQPPQAKFLAQLLRCTTTDEVEALPAPTAVGVRIEAALRKDAAWVVAARNGEPVRQFPRAYALIKSGAANAKEGKSRAQMAAQRARTSADRARTRPRG